MRVVLAAQDRLWPLDQSLADPGLTSDTSPVSSFWSIISLSSLATKGSQRQELWKVPPRYYSSRFVIIQAFPLVRAARIP